MNLIYLIKILNLIALTFIPLNYIFAVIGYNNTSGLIYLWLCIIGFLINYLKHQKSKFVFLSILIIFVPLIAARSFEEFIFPAIFCIVAIIIILKGMNTARYDIELELFNKGIYIIIGTFLASFLIGGIPFFSNYSAYYVIIYLVSAILLLRNLRLLQYSKDNREGKRMNNRYSITIIIFSFTLSISYVREFLIMIIKNSYLLIIDLFMYFFSWLIMGLAYIMSFAAKAIMAFIQKLGIKGQEFKLQVPNNILETPADKNRPVLIDKLLNNQVFQLFTKAFVILLVVYIIVRLFRSLNGNRGEQEEYWEEKEFILKEERSGKHPGREFFSFLKPRNNNEQIRLYYQKYMKACIDKDIQINEMDTTEEISNKSQIKFDKKLINGIRNIYIKIRYGEKESTKEMVDEMGEYVKGIKRQ